MKRTALVTGGLRGIGFDIAQRLAAESFNLAICDIRDEAEAAESFELPGADLSHEVLSVEVTPRQTDEFTCTACFLVQHESRRSSPTAELCRDCA